MKRLLIILLAVMAGYSAQAQQRFRYGFRIGGGLASQSYQNPAVKSVESVRVLSGSLIGEMQIKGPYSAQLTLGFTNKGATVFEDALTTTNKLLYAQATLIALRKFDLPSLGKLVVGLGPYFSRGYSGKLEYETPSSFTSDKVTYGNTNDFKNHDAGVNITTGLELNNKLTFNLGYDYGLSNIASQVLRDTGNKSIRNRVITLSLGYLF